MLADYALRGFSIVPWCGAVDRLKMPTLQAVLRLFVKAVAKYAACHLHPEDAVMFTKGGGRAPKLAWLGFCSPVAICN
eukprot:1330984-Alexandrium_andersonii.AAC.1